MRYFKAKTKEAHLEREIRILVAEEMGILIPLSLEVYELIPHYILHTELREHNPWISGIITTSVMIGGFAMRYVVIYAGQMAHVISS
jgi:formate-dependent nitrite reductase membrane component NrfD